MNELFNGDVTINGNGGIHRLHHKNLNLILTELLMHQTLNGMSIIHRAMIIPGVHSKMVIILL